MRCSCLWDRGPPPCDELTYKVYGGVHTLPSFGFEPMTFIQVDIGGHPPIPTGSSCLFFIQHIFLYCFIIVNSTLLGFSKASQYILQVDMGGLSPNPTSLFCIFSCQHILLYFQGCFGPLNIVFFTCHNETIDVVKV
jgi:hypothetical protein